MQRRAAYDICGCVSYNKRTYFLIVFNNTKQILKQYSLLHTLAYAPLQTSGLLFLFCLFFILFYSIISVMYLNNVKNTFQITGVTGLLGVTYGTLNTANQYWEGEFTLIAYRLYKPLYVHAHSCSYIHWFKRSF